MTVAMDTSISLLPAVAHGNLDAFERLYDRHSSTLYALLLRILANADDAQEVLQETFVKAWTNAKTFDSVRGSDVAWLISIARSRGIDRLRIPQDSRRSRRRGRAGSLNRPGLRREEDRSR
jgi:DNA-directed RNA polymerase specialized sigma subunit, sigma24 homolog